MLNKYLLSFKTPRASGLRNLKPGALGVPLGSLWISKYRVGHMLTVTLIVI